MLRIVVGREATGGVVRAEGQMIGPWVSELRRALEELLAAGIAPTVDLSGVSFVDRAGLGLLRLLQHRGVAVVNCSAFVAEQLKG